MRTRTVWIVTSYRLGISLLAVSISRENEDCFDSKPHMFFLSTLECGDKSDKSQHSKFFSLMCNNRGVWALCL